MGDMTYEGQNYTEALTVRYAADIQKLGSLTA